MGGGHFDGDGSVFISKRKNGALPLNLSVCKSIIALPTVQKFQSLFGGKIYKHAARPGRVNSRSETSWALAGEEAVKTACLLYPYVFAKKKQLAWAATYPCAVSTYTRKWPAGGDSWLSLDEVNAKREQIRLELKQLKAQGHEPIQARLPFAYIAGFVDADGSLGFRKGCTFITATQKYRAILDAICITLGGTVRRNSQHGVFLWAIYHGGAEALHFLLPYLIEKKEQAEIILRRGKRSAEEINKLLLPLKGRQGRVSKA